jgi:hypothetical protein
MQREAELCVETAGDRLSAQSAPVVPRETDAAVQGTLSATSTVRARHYVRHSAGRESAAFGAALAAEVHIVL